MSYPLNIAKGFGEAFAALSASLASANKFTLLLSRLGWRVKLTDEQMALITSLLGISSNLSALTNALADLESDDSDPNVAAVVEAAFNISLALYDLAQTDFSAIAQLPAPLNSEAFWIDDFAPRLINLLLIDLITDKASGLYGLMDVFGLVEPDIVDGSLWWFSSPAKLRWDRLLPAVTDPVGHLKTIYGWDDDLQTTAITAAIKSFVAALGLQTVQAPISDTVRARFFPDLSETLTIHATEVIFIENGFTRAGLRILPVNTDDDIGLYIEPFIQGIANASLQPSDALELALTAGAEASGTGLFITPEGQPETLGASVALDQKMSLIWQPEAPQVLIGKPDGMRLELADTEVSVTFTGSPADPEIIITLGGRDTGLKLILNPSEADSFVSELMKNVEINASLAARLVWSSKTGFAIEGSTGLEIVIPLNLEIAFVTLNELYLALALAAESLDITAAVTFTAELPPLTFTVNRIGLLTTVIPDDNPTTNGLGGLDLALAFKPPTGAGIALNFLDIVYGGGFIDLNAAKGEYSGMITVQLAVIGVTALTIITTKLPDDPNAWSMFVSINVNLGGIPLGFGFTLEKVGGLIGIHRSIATDVFLEGVRTGLLDSVLFPDDPIANAPRILSDIQAAFPTTPGSFVVGAMLQIGWGSPAIITGDVGFIIQVPDIILMLVGQAESVLPAEEAPLVEFHFDVVAVIDLSLGTLDIRAGLRDSQIVGFVLTGEMALKAAFLGQPSFLLALGGFHPAFVPPESFPSLQRLGFGLNVGDWLSIALETYLALSANTVQFGAGLYLSATFIGFRVEGGFEFNTMITFSPFQFVADLRFYITVSAGSIELLGVLLTGYLSGPNPYFIRGQAQFKLFGLAKEVNIEESIGEKSSLDEVDEVPLIGDLVAALEESENWRAVDEGARLGAVLLAGVSDPQAEPTVHPGGSAEVVQRLAPLDVELEHYGQAEIAGQDEFAIDDVALGGDDIAWEFVEDWFAPAQFFDMTNDEKLDAPSFEMMKAGVRFGDDAADGGASADALYNYEQIIRDPEFIDTTYPLKTKFTPSAAVISTLGQQKYVLVSSRPLIKRTPAAAQVYTLNPVRYVIVDRTTLRSGSGMPTHSMTHAEAVQKVHVNTSDQIVVTTGERVSA
ncbi:MAG: hypothetical protein IPK17_35975 [Chloroflexi bacterium]|uniref:DUF6603 domain-containing protein n=1 Tax=Candidatus Flexifilum breve TaxID=3140694 RepID=UPI0031359D26|nr:hypothetical protein [Chloroflexota bacterium]